MRNDNMGETEENNQLTVTNGALEPVDVDGAVAYWENYQKLTEELLDDSDYQAIGNKAFKKKSAWRKYATAFNISDEIIDKEITTDKMGRIVTAVYTVKTTAPNGRTGIGVGACSIFDKAHEFPTPNCQIPNCDGRIHFSNPENDIRATAHTRAKSRAISDIIGTGEVSAEEMDIQGLDKGNNKGSKKGSKRRKKTKKSTNTENKSEEPIEPENVQEAEFTKKETEPKEPPIADVTPPKSELEIEQEQTISKDKVGNEAINRLIQKNETIKKESLVNEVQNMLGEQLISSDESAEARKIIMKA